MVLDKPTSCRGCPLDTLSTGFMRPTIAGLDAYGVAILGDSLREEEIEHGRPFSGRSGFRLNRLIEWAGLDRTKFDFYNSTWCHPLQLEDTPLEAPSTAWCRAAHWGRLLEVAKVVLTLGNVPTRAVLGKGGILNIRGYVHEGQGQYVIPTVHPSYIVGGNAKWSAPFINDLQKAVELARHGMPPQITSYVLDPSPMEAYRWARDFQIHLASNPRTYLAFDIETPGKGDAEDEVDTDSDAPDRTWNIDRIGFSYRGLTGLSVPWAPEYMAAIRLLCESGGNKVVWNAGFDVPRIRRVGVPLNGTIHDGMVAWHILHSDLPKRLAFVATFTCPWQPAWKHLSGAKPAFYNCTDADVEGRSMETIEGELRRTGLWEVYQRDVLDLDPILVFMQQRGMPVDQEIRLDRAQRLAGALTETKLRMETTVPLESRRIAHVYKTKPKDTTALLSRPGTCDITVCSVCGAEKPGKPHFRVLKKRANPCASGTLRRCVVSCDEFYRLSDFSPSRDQLVRYHQHLKRPLPMVYDKKTRKRKVSFGERQLKDLMGKFPTDELYPAILRYRELDKIAGTYVGRPVEG